MLTGTSAIELKDNTVIVVLGASGDLAKKKTVRVTTRHPSPQAWSINWLTCRSFRLSLDS